MFKSEWEKTYTRVQVADEIILDMLQIALPGRSGYIYEQMSGGCANLNYKVSFKDDSNPILLRIYIRDPESAYREQKIAQLFEGCAEVPVAKVYFVGDCRGYRFALIDYICGVTLRDLLLHYESADWKNPVQDAGKMLAAVGRVEFPTAGFLDADLKVTKPFEGEGEKIYALLSGSLIESRLGLARTEKIRKVFFSHTALLPDASHHHLVHGDYDPSNMLVYKYPDRWRIVALLDWEFAFSGSRLWDVSNMLRYAHRVSPIYQESFLKGLTEAGVVLPDEWEKITYLLNIVSLVEAVERGDPEQSPNQYKDMYHLIDYQIKQLDS